MGKQRKDQGTSIGTKPFTHVSLRVFSHATEDPEKVVMALATAAGVDLDDEAEEARFAADLQETRSIGHYNNPITILTLELTRSREIKRFWNHFLTTPGVARRLGAEAEDRLDDGLTFWVRLDKQAAHDGHLRLSGGEDVIQVRAKVATYPKDRATALTFLRTFFAEGGDAQAAVAAATATANANTGRQ